MVRPVGRGAFSRCERREERETKLQRQRSLFENGLLNAPLISPDLKMHLSLKTALERRRFRRPWLEIRLSVLPSLRRAPTLAL